MATGVFHTGLRIVIDLTAPDLGHPDIPDLWEVLRSDTRPVAQRQLRCLQCMSDRPDCPEWMHLRELADGRRVAVHNNPSIGAHRSMPESPTHKALKERIATAAERAGFAADVEDVASHGRRRTDVLVHGENGLLLGCEAQIAYATAEAVRKRSKIAREDGITPLWTTNDNNAPLIDQAPWTRIDNLPRELIQTGGALLVRGGVKTLEMLRCDQRGTPCPDRRKGCTAWHGHWAPARGLQLDDAIVKAAGQELVPLEISRGRRGSFWMWVTPDDRDTYLDSIDTAPMAGRNPTRAASADVPDNRELDFECRYGQETEYRPARTVPRDSGALIDVPTLTQPVPEKSANATPRMPDPPPRVPVETDVCGALKTPDDPTVRCQEQALLYACGWRCDTHRPRTAAAT